MLCHRRAEVSRILTTIFRGIESRQGTREGQKYTEREVKAGAAPIENLDPEQNHNGVILITTSLPSRGGMCYILDIGVTTRGPI